MKTEKDEIDKISNKLYEKLVSELQGGSENEEEKKLISENVNSLLKPGTIFYRDIIRIKNQVTFKQYLDRSGVPDSIKDPVYKQISRIRSLESIFPDKTFIWRSLYLGCVYQALQDNAQLLQKIKD